MVKKGVLFSALMTVAIMTACVPQHKMIRLTPGGEKIILIGSEVPPAIPGRPLDNCAVVSQLKLVNSDHSIWYTTEDWDNALRNKTSETSGNVAVRIEYDFRYGLNPYSHSVQGMALQCPDDVLKAAGFNQTGYSLIEEQDSASTLPGKKRPERQQPVKRGWKQQVE